VYMCSFKRARGRARERVSAHRRARERGGAGRCARTHLRTHAHTPADACVRSLIYARTHARLFT